MSYLSNMTWFSNMQQYDERTVALLTELSNPQFTSRTMRRLQAVLHMESYTLLSIIKNLSSEGIVYMRNDRNGNVIIGLVERNSIVHSTLVQHRVNDKTVQSIVLEATGKDNNSIIANYLSKILPEHTSRNDIIQIIDDGIYKWERNNDFHVVDISRTKLIPS